MTAINIANGSFLAEITPQAGCAIWRLTHNGKDILRPVTSVVTAKEDPREAACYPCVPWFGRIERALEFMGRTYPLAPTLSACDAENAIHGHGWLSAWTVTQKTQDRLDCCLEYQPQDRQFPFPFRAVQSFEVGEQFCITLSIENTGASPIPAGLGLHPFFPRTDQTRLNVQNAREWRQGNDTITLEDNGALPVPETDHTAQDWAGEAVIRNGDCTVILQSNTDRLHLYAPHDESFFCLEPVTHLPGRFGADILAPGEVKSLSLAITVE